MFLKCFKFNFGYTKDLWDLPDRNGLIPHNSCLIRWGIITTTSLLDPWLTFVELFKKHKTRPKVQKETKDPPYYVPSIKCKTRKRKNSRYGNISPFQCKDKLKFKKRRFNTKGNRQRSGSPDYKYVLSHVTTIPPSTAHLCHPCQRSEGRVSVVPLLS